MQPGPYSVGGPYAKLPSEGGVIVRDHLALHWGALFGSHFTRTIMIGAVGALVFSVTTIFIVESLVLLSLYPTRKVSGVGSRHARC